MGRGATDPSGTAAEAAATNLSRRQIQRRRKALLAVTEVAAMADTGVQMTLPGVLPALKYPAAQRIDASRSAARAGALEIACAERCRQALMKGDAPAVKIFTSAWQDVVKCCEALERMAERQEQKRRWSIREDALTGVAPAVGAPPLTIG